MIFVDLSVGLCTPRFAIGLTIVFTAEWSIIYDLCFSVQAVYPAGHWSDKVGKTIDLSKSSPSYKRRSSQLKTSLVRRNNLLKVFTETAISVMASGKRLRFLRDPCSTLENVYYSQAYQQALDHHRTKDIPFIVLEHAWFALPDINLELDFTTSLPPQLSESDVQREIAGAVVVSTSTPNLGIPFSTEKFTLSGHSYAGASDVKITNAIAPSPAQNQHSYDLRHSELEVQHIPTHPTYIINRSILKTVARLFSDGDEEQRVGKVSWKDITTVCSSSSPAQEYLTPPPAHEENEFQVRCHFRFTCHIYVSQDR
jgi:hypothetical protein